MGIIRTSAVILVLLNLVLSEMSEKDKCSHGDLQYLCQNYEICAEFGMIDENIYKTLGCDAFQDPVPDVDGEIESSDVDEGVESSEVEEQNAESAEESTEESAATRDTEEFTTSRGNVEGLTSSRGDDAGDLTSSRDVVTYGDTTTDNGIVTVGTTDRAVSESTTDRAISDYRGTTDRAISDYRGTTDSLDISTPYFTEDNGIMTGTFATQENGIQTQEPSAGPTEGNTRDFETFSAAHTRDSYTVTGTDSYDFVSESDPTSAPTESNDPSTSANESDSEDRQVTVTPSESDDPSTSANESDDREVTVTPSESDDSLTSATEADSDEFDGTEAPTVYDDTYTTESDDKEETEAPTVYDDTYTTESDDKEETEAPTVYDDTYTTESDDKEETEAPTVYDDTYTTESDDKEETEAPTVYDDTYTTESDDKEETEAPTVYDDTYTTESDDKEETEAPTVYDDTYTTESDDKEETEAPTVYDDTYTTESADKEETEAPTVYDDAYTTATETESVSRVVTVTPTDDSYTTADSYTTEFQTDDGYTTASSPSSTEARTEEAPIIGRPPVISVPPVNITVPPGGTGRFDCTARAATTPQITITKKDQTTVPDLNNFGEANGNGLSQTTINSITINNVDLPNEGWYTCQAVNKYGYVRHDAYLHIKDLCEGVVCEGDRICKGNYEAGEGHTCECPQYCDYTELIVPDYVCSNYCEDHFNECAMKTDACNNNKFAIEILNSGRCGSIEQPVIMQAEEEYGIKDLIPGETLNLECHANGFPEPNIVWYRGTDVVGSGNELSITVTEEDAGEYICEAVNCMRSKVSKRLALVFVTEVTTPPIPTTASPSPTPTVEISPAENSIPDPPRSTCAVYGDPHFLTYDQRAYSYMGTCDNVLAMDCEMARWFVYGRMRPCGRSGGSCLETVTVYVDYEILELQRGWLVNRNGAKIVPKNHPNKKIVVEGRRNNFTLEFDGAILTLSAVLNRRPSDMDPNQMLEDKLVVHWDGYVSVQIQTPQNTRTCGMCGDNDANPDNDMRTRRRGLTDDPVEFGDSWKIDPRGRCAETSDPKTPEEVCGDQYEEARAECERIFNIPKFQDCRDNGGHDTTTWIESCIYDHCEGLMQQDQLPPKCIVAGAYATRCGHDYWDREFPFPTRTEQVRGWEAEAGCPTADERFQPVLDTGCPQPTLEEELAGNFK